MKAITSASEEELHNLSRCWIYGHDDSFPFLFIHGGAATVSGTALGGAVIRDAVTQQEVQLLRHTGIHHFLSRTIFNALVRGTRPLCPSHSTYPCSTFRRADRFLTPKAYHISKERHTIVTVDRGKNAKIKVWTARRASTLLQDRVSGSSRKRKPKALTCGPDSSWIPFAKGIDHRHPARIIDHHSAAANGEDPRYYQGIPDIPTSMRHAYLHPRSCAFSPKSDLCWHISSSISDTLSSNPSMLLLGSLQTFWAEFTQGFCGFAFRTPSSFWFHLPTPNIHRSLHHLHITNLFVLF